MKIAVFYNLKFGGAKRVVMDQVKYFSTNGNIVDVFTINHEKDFFDPSPFAHRNYNYKLALNGQKIPLLNKVLFWHYLFWRLKRLHKKIAFDINRNRYDVVIVHPDMFTQAPFLLRFLKAKSLYYCQEPYRIAYEHSMRIDDKFPFYIKLYEHILRYFVKVVDRKNVGMATGTIASSHSVRERMIQAYNVFPKICPPGIDTSIFKKRNVKKDNSILFVGSKTDQIDGHDLLMQALSLIPKSERPNVVYVVWRNKNNERITEVELSKIYSKSKATMCLSRFETFGLIPLESMACGTPVIATDIGGHRETVKNGITGFLVDPFAQDISAKLFELISSKKYAYYSKQAENHVSKNWNVNLRNKQFLEYIEGFIKK